MRKRRTSEIDIHEERFRQSTHDILAGYSVIENRHNVLIIRGRMFGSGADVFAKYYKSLSGSSMSRAHAEFLALKRYHAEMSASSSCGVPEPYTIVPDGVGGVTLICEWIDLLRGDVWFKLWSPFEFMRRRGLRRSASWLRRFHETGGIEAKTLDHSLDSDRLVADYVKLNDLFNALNCGEGPSPGQTAILSRALSAASKKTVMHSHLHGDFTPGNIFLTPRRVVGFDFTAKVAGPVLQDVGKFLTSLVWYGHFGIGGRRGEKFMRDGDVFLKTYSVDSFIHDEVVVVLFYVRSLLDHVHRVSAQFGSAPATKQKYARGKFAMIADVLGYLSSRLVVRSWWLVFPFAIGV